MFDANYEVILADTEAARAIHRKIRYHVYCVERQFEPRTAFPLGEEHDSWDIHAAQFIVRKRSSGAWVAAMRIILPHAVSFPLETLQCLPEPPPQDYLNRHELGEVSRICIIHSQGPNEINPHLDWNFGHVDRSGEPEVLIGLIRASILYGLAQGIKHYYLLVTGAFARLLRRLGLVMDQTGVAIEHRGWRTPYLMDLQESVATLGNRSTVVRDLFARKALAYRSFSTLDNGLEVLLEQMLRSTQSRTTTVRPPLEPQWSRIGPDFWRMETERTVPGPDVWKLNAPDPAPASGAAQRPVRRFPEMKFPPLAKGGRGDLNTVG